MDDPAEAAKTVAARAAVQRYVRPGMRLALGTGSTASCAVRALRDLHPQATFECVASSAATEQLARSLGLGVRALRGEDRFDLMIDGADEVTEELALTKGGGGALLREKFLARLSARLVIVVDPSKVVRRLGERHPIPVEVVPYCRAVLEHELEALRLGPRRRLSSAGAPFRTENGNELLDLRPPEPIEDPQALERRLRSLVGVVETGLFLGIAERAVVGEADGAVREILPPAGTPAR